LIELRSAEDEELAEVFGFVLVGFLLKGDGDGFGGGFVGAVGELAAALDEVDLVVDAIGIDQVEVLGVLEPSTAGESWVVDAA
jgi:hypothetical protein